MSFHGFGGLFDEPPQYGVEAIEALEIWELMGCELRLEALSVVLAMHPAIDPELLVVLLKVIARAVRKSGET